MKNIHLDTPMKLMKHNNESYPPGTQFVYHVPHYIFDIPDLQVVCSLIEDKKMAYILNDDFNHLDGISRIESLLWGLSTYAKVQLKESNEEALLLKQGLFLSK